MTVWDWGFLRELRAYDEDQARDDHGRWTKSGEEAGEATWESRGEEAWREEAERWKSSPGEKTDWDEIADLCGGNVKVGTAVAARNMFPLARAIRNLPDKVKSEIKTRHAIDQVRVRDKYQKLNVAAGRGVVVAGVYSYGKKRLTISTKRGWDVPRVTTHETLHAFDSKGTMYGRYSQEEEWRQICDAIKTNSPDIMKPYFHPFELNHDASNSEMFAELGALHIMGRPLTLNSKDELPPQLGGMVEDYFNGLFRTKAAVARMTRIMNTTDPDDDDNDDTGHSCFAIELPDGDVAYITTGEDGDLDPADIPEAAYDVQ